MYIEDNYPTTIKHCICNVLNTAYVTFLVSKYKLSTGWSHVVMSSMRLYAYHCNNQPTHMCPCFERPIPKCEDGMTYFPAHPPHPTSSQFPLTRPT